MHKKHKDQPISTVVTDETANWDNLPLDKQEDIFKLLGLKDAKRLGMISSSNYQLFMNVKFKANRKEFHERYQFKESVNAFTSKLQYNRNIKKRLSFTENKLKHHQVDKMIIKDLMEPLTKICENYLVFFPKSPSIINLIAKQQLWIDGQIDQCKSEEWELQRWKQSLVAAAKELRKKPAIEAELLLDSLTVFSKRLFKRNLEHLLDAPHPINKHSKK